MVAELFFHGSIIVQGLRPFEICTDIGLLRLFISVKSYVNFVSDIKVCARWPWHDWKMNY